MKKYEPLFEKPTMGLKRNHILRIPADKDLIDLVHKGIDKLAQGGYLEVKFPAYCRQALRVYSNMVLTNQVGLVFKPIKDKNKKSENENDYDENEND